MNLKPMPLKSMSLVPMPIAQHLSHDQICDLLLQIGRAHV